MHKKDCLFCRIVSGEVQANIIYESSTVIAFRDLNPQAPTHILIVPKKHIATIDDITSGDLEIVGSMYLAAQEIAVNEKIVDMGYRTVMNCNEAAGQTVFHIHLHLLGGRAFSWPPG
jgi:histidine triad (HIT) family protein